jgi:hypothetical protein
MQDTVVSFGKPLAGGHARPGTGQSANNEVGATRSLQIVRGYWEGLRSNGAPPMRDALDPRGIAGALEQVFMIERLAPGLARFRLAGSQINELMGGDVRGMPMSVLFDPVARQAVSPVLEMVFAGPSIAHLKLEAESGIGRPALAARLMILPLLSFQGRVDLALGCLAFDAPIGRAPRRFAITHSHNERLILSEPPLVSETDSAATTDLPSLPRSSGHLRLVHSAR